MRLTQAQREVRPSRNASGLRIWNLDNDSLIADAAHLVSLPGMIKILASPDENQFTRGRATVWAGEVKIHERPRLISADHFTPACCGGPSRHIFLRSEKYSLLRSTREDGLLAWCVGVTQERSGAIAARTGASYVNALFDVAVIVHTREAHLARSLTVIALKPVLVRVVARAVNVYALEHHTQPYDLSAIEGSACARYRQQRS